MSILFVALLTTLLFGCRNGEAKLEVALDDNAAITADTPLDTVKQYLTVTYVDENGKRQVVEDYVLKGTLTEGECTITVVFGITTEKVVLNVAKGSGLNGGATTEGLKMVSNGDGTYNVDDIGVATDRDIVIPSTYNGKAVTGISANAFVDCDNVTSIFIPEGITTIGESAFKNCSRMKNVSIASSVKQIDTSAFSDCAILENAYFRGTVTQWCEINFADENANPTCKAKNLYIDGELLTGEVDIIVDTQKISDYAFANCPNVTKLTIGGAKQIGKCAFHRLPNLTTVVINDGVEQLGSQAFYGNTQLLSITIPNSVSTIGTDLLSYCNKLTTLSIPFLGVSRTPAPNSHIGYLFGSDHYTYNDYHLPETIQTVTLTDGTEIPDYAFFNTKSLKTVNIEDFTKIGDSAFEYCELLQLTSIPSTLTHIGNSAFHRCLKVNVSVIPETVRFLGAGAFSNTGITEIEVKYKGETLPSSIFNGCSLLTSVTLPSTITVIDSSALSNCTMLKTISLSQNITSIGSFAVSGGIDTIRYEGTKAQWEQIVLDEDWNGNSWSDGHVKTIVCSDETITVNPPD